MMKLFIILFILTLFGCSHQNEVTKEALGLDITEVQANKWTALTKQNLVHLAQVYDLEPFLFTRKIHIQPKATPHSHPILTLNTRYAEYPNKLLSALLHEELHWWASSHTKMIEKAILELRKIYPTVPLDPGARDDHSTYLHLVICYLEYVSLVNYLGEREAKKIINDFIKTDKLYPWIYTQVLEKNFAIKRTIHKFRLFPPVLR
jgi:hypothetical protein